MNEELLKPYIPKNDTGYVETFSIDLMQNGVRDIDMTIPPKPLMRHEIEMWDTINDFENDSWKPQTKGLDCGFESINKAFDGGIKPGFIIVAADSNVGKSIFINQLASQLVNNNDDIYVMDFSLDDAMQDKLSRIVACDSKIFINSIKSPLNYSEYPLMLARRLQGMNRLRSITDKYRAYDSTFTTDIEAIEAEILRVKIDLDAAGINKQIVVFVDGFHDLTTSTYPNYQDRQKYDHLAQVCGNLATKYSIPLICTAEFRKVNNGIRPMLDDVREAVKIKYKAKAVLLCYNDVHYKSEGANVFFQRSDITGKQPVFEVHFAKNKFHSYKGRLFFESYPEMARMEEVDDVSAKHYSSILTGN